MASRWKSSDLSAMPEGYPSFHRKEENPTAYCGTGNKTSDLSFETCQSMSALLADVNVPENIARYVFCCTKLRLQQKTPCSAEGLGLDSEVVMPVPFNI